MDGSRPAGFWVRTIALVVDFALFFLVLVSYRVAARLATGIDARDAWTLTPVLWAFTLLFAAAYTTALHAAWGQTIGKMLAGVRVVEMDGEPPRVGVALLRYCGYFASLATLLLGYLMAGLRRDKRALHDLIAGTRVERVAPRAPRSEPSPAGAPLAPADQLSPPPA